MRRREQLVLLLQLASTFRRRWSGEHSLNVTIDEA
jgi:hypothetical protein